jgi:hypothetical protein
LTATGAAAAEAVAAATQPPWSSPRLEFIEQQNSWRVAMRYDGLARRMECAGRGIRRDVTPVEYGRSLRLETMREKTVRRMGGCDLLQTWNPCR